MAGIHLTIDASALAPLQARVQGMGQLDTRSLMAQLGEYLQSSTQDRFKTQTAPDGSAWQVLFPHTLKRKKHNPQKVLTERDFLRKNIRYQVLGSTTVQVRSNSVYAAMHQFGGTTSANSMMPNKPIPARTFLGLSHADRQEIQDIIADWARTKGFK